MEMLDVYYKQVRSVLELAVPVLSLAASFYSAGKEAKLGEFTMVSQPIRLILVDWLYAKRKKN